MTATAPDPRSDQLAEARISPDGRDLAIRNNQRDDKWFPWRVTDGSQRSDSQVADWIPVSPTAEVEARVQAAANQREAEGVAPTEIVRQRALRWPDFHPEDFCHRCGRPNVSSWWVDSPQWNAAVEGENRGVVSILCPSCFTGLWEQATGKTVSWELRIDPRSRDARGPDTARWFTLTLNGQDVTVAEVPALPERGLTSLTYDYRTAIQVRSVDDLDGRVLLHEVLHALLRTDPQQVCPADDPRHEDFVRMLTAGLHDAAGFRRATDGPR